MAKLILGMGKLFFAAVILVSLAAAAQKPSVPDPIFREDLHPFGYPQKLPHQLIADYTDLAFLSDDLILVSMNERSFANFVELLNADKPPSRLLLFDISQKTLVRSSERAVEKFMGSVHSTHDGNFVVLDQSGIQLCSKELECGLPSPIAGPGPLFVSPRGTRILAGGNGQNEQMFLDADSLKTINHFAFGQAAMPGDVAVLATRGKQLYLLRDDGREKVLNFHGGGLRLDAQFLSDDVFATYENDRTFVSADLDSSIRYRISILPQWSGTDIVPAASGSRFCIHQYAYKVRGSKLSVSDEHRIRDVDIYRIFDTHSGEALFHFEWDPRPYIALSWHLLFHPADTDSPLFTAVILRYLNFPEFRRLN